MYIFHMPAGKIIRLKGHALRINDQKKRSEKNA
jgi:hypothetical protein